MCSISISSNATCFLFFSFTQTTYPICHAVNKITLRADVQKTRRGGSLSRFLLFSISACLLGIRRRKKEKKGVSSSSSGEPLFFFDSLPFFQSIFELDSALLGCVPIDAPLGNSLCIWTKQNVSFFSSNWTALLMVLKICVVFCRNEPRIRAGVLKSVYLGLCCW